MNFCDLIIKLISICMAIRGYAKDIHYSAQGNNMYGEHIFADVVESPDADILDELKEVCFLGRNYRVPDSAFLMQESIKYYPAKTNDDSQNWSYLRSLIAQAMFVIEQISGQATAGEANIIGAIAQELQKNIGLINLRLGFPLLEEEDLGDIANNERWITVKPHGDEEKGRHLKLEDGETPKDAMKRQWVVDLDKKKKDKEEKDKPSDGADKKDKKTSSSLKESEKIKKEIEDMDKEYDERIKQEKKLEKERDNLYNQLVQERRDEPSTPDKYQKIFEEANKKTGYGDFYKKTRELGLEIYVKQKEYRKIVAKEYVNPEKIANVAQGTKMSQEKANGGSVNPKYSERGGYTINCQSCVVCYEARLRGYDVSTKPNTRGSKLDKLSHQTYAAWLDPDTGEYPKTILPENPVKNYRQYYEFLKEKLKEGERYNMGFAWKGRSRSGHIVTMYKENGEVILYDTQNGKKYKNKELADEYLSRIKFSGSTYGISYQSVPQLYRVDNMAFNPEYVNDIMEAANGR